MIDFTKAYEYPINQSLIERLWRKKGCPGILVRKQLGMRVKIWALPHGDVSIIL